MLANTLDRCDNLNWLPLLLLFNLLFVLFAFVFEIFYDLIFDFFLALVVKAKRSSFLCVFATLFAAEFFLLVISLSKTKKLSVNLAAVFSIKANELLFVGKTLLFCATEELLLEEFTTIGILQGGCICIRSAFGLPIDLS